MIERGKQKDIIPIYSEDKNQSTMMATHIELHIQFSVPDNIIKLYNKSWMNIDGIVLGKSTLSTSEADSETQLLRVSVCKFLDRYITMCDLGYWMKCVCLTSYHL